MFYLSKRKNLSRCAKMLMFVHLLVGHRYLLYYPG